jgi:hypothetical protein
MRKLYKLSPFILCTLIIVNTPVDMNGYDWQMMNQEQKTYLVSGILISSLYSGVYLNMQGKITREVMEKTVIQGITAERLVEYIDKFYEKRSNLGVCIGVAILRIGGR